MGRKLSEQEKARRAANRALARERAALGPLFASQAVRPDEHALLMERRRGMARLVEYTERLAGDRLLDGLFVEHLKRLAAPHLDQATFARLDAYCRDTYPAGQYHAAFWRGVLAGKQVIFSWRRVPAPGTTLGFRAVPDEVFPPPGWQPPYTEDQMRFYFWAECKGCGLQHAPGQTECLPRTGQTDQVNPFGGW